MLKRGDPEIDPETRDAEIDAETSSAWPKPSVSVNSARP